jgi:hypothetical protein
MRTHELIGYPAVPYLFLVFAAHSLDEGWQHVRSTH